MQGSSSGVKCASSTTAAASRRELGERLVERRVPELVIRGVDEIAVVMPRIRYAKAPAGMIQWQRRDLQTARRASSPASINSTRGRFGSRS